MKSVVVVDPYAGGFNTGDLIIKEAVLKELHRIRPDLHVYFVSLHQPLTDKQRSRLKDADLVVVAGSNMFSERYWPVLRQNRWPLSWRDIPVLRGRVLLAGVGLARYRQTAVRSLLEHVFLTHIWARLIYREILTRDVMHSVRDSRTRDKLVKEFGISNVVNTSCPSLWDVRYDAIPVGKGRHVVFTLTDYAKDQEADKALIRLLKDNYKRVYFWPQGFYDMAYLGSLGCDGIHIIAPPLAAFDELLRSEEGLDYVGTRLHAAIRAMQHGRRSIIVGTDMRAISMAEDVGLIVVPRGDMDALEEAINRPQAVRLRLPVDAIDAWREALRKKLR